MATRNKDYGLVDIEEEALFELLPHVVKATDPGAIQTLMRSSAVDRNYFIQKLRDLPRLQDPAKTSRFTAGTFGEDPLFFAELLALRKVTAPTTLELERIAFLESLLPKTLAAEKTEIQMLNLLSKTVGNANYGQYQVAAMRELISTAILRHRIKGTPTSIFSLGRILGFIDIKITELWSRFSIKDPADPKALRNISDFAATPEDYPYWPLDKVYDGTITRSVERGVGANAYTLDEQFQVPLPSAVYDPTIIDDGGPDYTITFEQASNNVESPYHYNKVVNDHNPFGNFIEFVTGRLTPSVYVLTGGTVQKRASVAIPILDSSETATFEAVTTGDWANGVIFQVFTNAQGNQRISITGPQSKIKFKSSFFDVALTMDAQIFPSLFAPIAVQPNDSPNFDLDLTLNPQVLNIVDVQNSTYGPQFPKITVDATAPSVNTVVEFASAASLDGKWTVLALIDSTTMVVANGPQTYLYDWVGGGTATYGRQAGDYPWTGASDGVQEIADPATLYQMADEVYLEIAASLREMLEEVRPITRTIRKEKLGYLLRDQVRYAPLTITSEVVLQAPGGTKYSAVVEEGNVVSWETSVASTTDVIQRDPADGILYRWSITDAGVWEPEIYLLSEGVPVENIVFLTTGDLRAYFYISNGELVGSLSSPEQAVESIHTDGTLDESVIGLEYANVVENPLTELLPYLNDEASSDDEPGDDFAFQTSPEDDLSVKTMLQSDSRSHLANSFPDDDFGFTTLEGGGWRYDFEGNFLGSESRHRHCGIHDNIITPPESGTEEAEDGLIYNYPIDILNFHNKAVWRDRVDNTPQACYYIFEPVGDNKRVGGQRIDYAVTGDGASECGVADVAGVGVTCNDRVFDEVDELCMPWQKYSRASYSGRTLERIPYESNSVLAWTEPENSLIHVGEIVRIVGNSIFAAELTVTVESLTATVGGYIVETSEAWNGAWDATIDDEIINVWRRRALVQLWEDENITYALTPPDLTTLGTNNYRIVSENADGTGYTILASGTVGFGGLENSIAVTRGKLVFIELHAEDDMTVRLTHEMDSGKITEADWGGEIMRFGGHRDDIAVTIVTDSDDWHNINSAETDTTTGLVNGHKWWRGGNWPDP